MKSMLLVDILARDLDFWPQNALADIPATNLAQDDDGMICTLDPNKAPNANQFDGRSWRQSTWTGLGLKLEVSSDFKKAIVTRAEWQAAVDALNAGKVFEWDGVGLPPIGIDVEVFTDYSHPRFDRFVGHKVHIVAHDVINGDPVAVFRMPVDGDDTEQDYHAMVAGYFRPIRTPEQIKKEERSKACDAIYGVLTGNTVERKGNKSDMAEALYDAGYRRVEQ